MSWSIGRLLMHESGVRLGEPRHPHDGHVVEVIDGPTVRKSKPGVTYYKVTCHDCSKKTRSEFYTFETMEEWLTPTGTPDPAKSHVLTPGDRVIVRPERQPEFEAVVVSIDDVRANFRADAIANSLSTWVRALSGHYSQWHTFKLEYIPRSTLVIRVGYLHDDEPIDPTDTIAVIDYLAENHDRLRVSNE